MRLFALADLAPDLLRPGEDALLCVRAFVHALAYRPIHLLIYTRHAEEQVWPRLAQILREVIERLHVDRLEAAIHADEMLQTAKDVREWQEERIHHALTEFWEHCVRALELRQEGAVAVDYALGHARRAGGIHQRQQVVGLDLAGALGREGILLLGAAFAQRQQVGERDHPGIAHLFGALEEDDFFDVGNLGANAIELIVLGLVFGEDIARAGVVEDKRVNGGRVGGIERDSRGAKANVCPIGHGPFPARAAGDTDHVAAPGAQFVQPGDQAVHHALVLAPSGLSPGAVALLPPADLAAKFRGAIAK